jgi:hypothetical protein
MLLLSKSHCQNGFPTGRRAGSLASIYASLWQSVDQIQRLVSTTFAALIKNQIHKRKSPLSQSRTACCFHYKGLENAKAGLVALAVICNALCKLTSKSAQVVFYQNTTKNASTFLVVSLLPRINVRELWAHRMSPCSDRFHSVAPGQKMCVLE